MYRQPRDDYGMSRDDYGSGLSRGGRLSTATADYDDEDEFASLRPPKGKTLIYIYIYGS